MLRYAWARNACVYGKEQTDGSMQTRQVVLLQWYSSEYGELTHEKPRSIEDAEWGENPNNAHHRLLDRDDTLGERSILKIHNYQKRGEKYCSNWTLS